MENNSLQHAIKAASIHKNIGKYIRNIITPNMSLGNIASIIENKIIEETKVDINNPLKAGIAFPVGLSLNNCAAHYTPNYQEPNKIIKNTDILKVDYGVHIKGTIIDSAFTLHFDPKYDEFIQISKDLTNFAVSLCGPDAVLGDIGASIEEYILSKTIEIDGKVYPLRTMNELCGHSILKYQIHGGKAVPNTAIDYPLRMKPFEYYAIEPFITTGNGKSILQLPNSHYMMNKHHNGKLTYHELQLYNLIKINYDRLPFCQKWLYQLDNKLNHDQLLLQLENKKIINSYPPIYDIENSIVSQFEHTIFIKENGIVNLTKNEFY